MAQKNLAAQPQVNVQELISQIPGIQIGESNPIFEKFMDVLAPLVDLPPTSKFVLDAFSSRDVTAEKLSLALRRNFYFQQVFYQVMDSVSKRKEDMPQPSLESAIVLLGMQNSRNLILGIQMLRTVLGTYPEWTKEGKLKTDPKNYLKYALAVEEGSAGKKEEYFDLAFSAGMLFDTFAMISEAQENKKKLIPFLDAVYKSGYRAAQVAGEISKTIPEFGFRRHVFAACMIHDIGKIAMAILEPSYLEFVEECTKKDIPRALRKYAEFKRFGINHSLLGALVCSYYKVFAPISRAILYQQEPFLLSIREKKTYELCALMSFSTNISENFKKVDKLDDPILERWKGPELAGFKVDMAKVLQAVGKVP